MATYNIYTKALEMLKQREVYHGKRADHIESYTIRQCELSEASAYNSAWWILYYAIHEDWDGLNQYDYFGEE